MLVLDEVVLDLSFAVARERLDDLVYSALVRASETAYGDALAGLTRVGPLGTAPGVSTLVDVHCVSLATGDDSVLLRLQWEAAGSGGRLFPALDAEIALVPVGEHSSRLSLEGTYRPPLAVLGAGLDKMILHRVAAATTRSFLNRIAEQLLQSPAQPPPGRSAPVGSGRLAPQFDGADSQHHERRREE